MSTTAQQSGESRKKVSVVAAGVALILAIVLTAGWFGASYMMEMQWDQDPSSISYLPHARAKRIAEDITGGQAKTAAFITQGGRKIYKVRVLKDAQVRVVTLDAQTGAAL